MIFYNSEENGDYLSNITCWWDLQTWGHEDLSFLNCHRDKTILTGTQQTNASHFFLVKI